MPRFMPYISSPRGEDLGSRAASTFLNPRHMIAESAITAKMNRYMPVALARQGCSGGRVPRTRTSRCDAVDLGVGLAAERIPGLSQGNNPKTNLLAGPERRPYRGGDTVEACAPAPPHFAIVEGLADTS